MESDCIAVECTFRTTDDFWRFFQFPGLELSGSVFVNVEHQVFSDGAQICLPPIFDVSYLRRFAEKRPVPEYLVLQLYSKDLPLGLAARQMEAIEGYQDYMDSDCQMMILAYDGLCAEVYCKNPAWLHTIVDNAVRLPGTEVTPKSVLTDARTTMYL